MRRKVASKEVYDDWLSLTNVVWEATRDALGNYVGEGRAVAIFEANAKGDIGALTKRVARLMECPRAV